MRSNEIKRDQMRSNEAELTVCCKNKHPLETSSNEEPIYGFVLKEPTKTSRVSLHTGDTMAQKDSFTCREQIGDSSLYLVIYFPESYNMSYFKSRINELDLISLSS